MLKHRILIHHAFLVLVAMALISCGSQPVVQSDAGESGEQTIEIIPRKDLEEPTIEIEPLPAETPTEVVVEESTVEPETEVKINKDSITESPKEPAPVKKIIESEAAVKDDAPSQTGKQLIEPAQKPEKPVQDSAKNIQPESSESATVSIEIPKDPNTFLVTVGLKAAPHPYIGKGHAMGFLINGVSGKQLVLERGKTYTFDIRTDPKHDVYLSTKVIGWGSAPIAEGVTGDYTYKGKMTFTPSNSTPDKVYYSCRNHPHMGALIQIINPGEKPAVIKQTPASSAATAAINSLGAKAKETGVSASKVKQKLMFAEMMSKSKGSKRVLASQNTAARQLVVDAKSLILKGHEKSRTGELPEALALADESLKMMSEAARLVPGEEELSQLMDKYDAQLVEIRDYRESHKENLMRLEKLGSVSDDARYDKKEVDKKLSEAQSYADKNNYLKANDLLSEVNQIVTVALHKMLDSRTIVYDLNFATAKDEYNYELKRFVGYEELIPVAIEAKKPAPGAIKLMESFHDKARKRRDQAVARAAEGEYGDAIAMLQQATKTVRRALRMVGVMQ